MQPPFWEKKSLWEMSREEWESLCDGCARCCVYKVEDEATGEVTYSEIACRYLDTERCRCTCYADRKRKRPDCVTLSPDRPDCFDWLPETCAYRRLFEGRGLPFWHPLITGRPASTQEAGMTVRNRVVSEDDVEALMDGESLQFEPG